MFWADRITQGVEGAQIINDSKTPSGRVHVGALRGVLIHDAVFRTLKERGVPVRYLFGVDDYDPLDEIPAGHGEYFRPRLGMPLCNVPALPGSGASDIAEHYIGEFFAVFRELGVEAETYRMRDVYRSGRFNEVIDVILRNAATVRRVYKEVSGSQRPESWYPFQVVCESCGRIGTTEVTAYDGREVTYACRPDLVTWASGCGHRGRVSPFDGRGKLPWKLEWTAKWKVFPVTIEGAGKDHNTRGGSREVAARCLREIFRQKAPLNIPYEFFLVGGAKMSSSRGIGASAREIADLLPPEVLRFLVLRPQPNQPVNFAPDEKYITKLFNDFDRAHWRTFNDPKVPDEDRRVYHLSEIRPEGDFFEPGFSLLLALLQLPHLLDLETEVAKRKGAPLTEVERAHLERRVQSAQRWLRDYAADEERIVLQQTLPVSAQMLTATQRAFLHRLAGALESADWEEEALQALVFRTARLTPIDQPRAFQAIYQVLLARDSGPKAGNLLAFLERAFVVQRFRELPFAATDFWRESGVSTDEVEKWIADNATRIRAADATLALGAHTQNGRVQALGVIEFQFTLDDDKTYTQRALVPRAEGAKIDLSHESPGFGAFARDYLNRLASSYGVTIRLPGDGGIALED
jgi:lysyl-tRNA synthetase class 1